MTINPTDTDTGQMSPIEMAIEAVSFECLRDIIASAHNIALLFQNDGGRWTDEMDAKIDEEIADIAACIVFLDNYDIVQKQRVLDRLKVRTDRIDSMTKSQMN